MLLHLINVSYSITEHLYNSAQEAVADRICNIYGSRGYEFLRDIYEKYQKNTKNKLIISFQNSI